MALKRANLDLIIFMIIRIIAEFTSLVEDPLLLVITSLLG